MRIDNLPIITIEEAGEIFHDNVADVFGVDDPTYQNLMTTAYKTGAKWMYIKLTEYLYDNRDSFEKGDISGLLDNLRSIFFKK